jgi:hypothetical protein
MSILGKSVTNAQEKARMKMKNNIILSVSFLISLVIMFLIHSNAIAEYSFNDPEVPKESEESASLLFNTLSLTFLSFEELERNKIDNVREIKDKILKNLEEVLEKQKIIKKKSSKREITPGMVPSDQLPMIIKDFERYNIKFPSLKNELPDIAIQQIELFSKFIGSKDFGDNASENRKLIRLIINEVWRIVVLGVDLSEIAASYK